MNTVINKLRKVMREKSLDAMWISSHVNHQYISSFANPDGCLLVCLDAAYAFEDFRYIEAAKREIDKDTFEIIMPETKRSKWLQMFLELNNIKNVGYEDNYLTCRQLENLINDTINITFLPAGDIFDKMREIKDEHEVEKIKAAQAIAEKSFDELLETVTYDVTEKELAARLEFFMKRNGADEISFETIAVSGKNSSSPHGTPRNCKIEKGFLTFDFGAVCSGYHSDMTRTICVGKADSAMKKLYNTVLDAQLAVLGVIGCGQSCFKMDKIARDIIENAGYKNAFGHSLGHGVGLEIHERPNLSPSSGDAKLSCGQIVTVEPGIYLAGKYGCRIEDMVYITENGAINLTKTKKELIEI